MDIRKTLHLPPRPVDLAALEARLTRPIPLATQQRWAAELRDDMPPAPSGAARPMECIEVDLPARRMPPDYLTLSAILTAPLRWRFLVQGLLQEGRVYQLFGPWKAGKSLVAMDMALHLADGREWAGRKVQRALVVYVAGEAVQDISARIKGFALARGFDTEGPLFWLRCRPVYLTDNEHAAQLREEIDAFRQTAPDVPVLLVVDTLARNFGPGRTESSDVDMGDFVNNLIDEVVRPTDATGLVVHHSGHAEKGRGRGHSSLPAAVDGTLAVSKSENVVSLESRESRNTQGGDALHFRLEVAELPDTDNFGEAVTVPVLRFLEDYTPAPPATEADSKHLRTAATIVERLAREQTDRLERQGLPVPDVTLVRLQDVRAEFERVTDGRPDTVSRAWRRLTTELASRYGGGNPLKVFP